MLWPRVWTMLFVSLGRKTQRLASSTLAHQCCHVCLIKPTQAPPLSSKAWQPLLVPPQSWVCTPSSVCNCNWVPTAGTEEDAGVGMLVEQFESVQSNRAHEPRKNQYDDNKKRAFAWICESLCSKAMKSRLEEMSDFDSEWNSGNNCESKVFWVCQKEKDFGFWVFDQLYWSEMELNNFSLYFLIYFYSMVD